MHITYVLLSPTFGMHQYTADLANRAEQWSGVRDQGSGVECQPAAGWAARLVTTTTLPRDRYSPAVPIVTPVTAHGTGFSREGLGPAAYRRVLAALAADPPASRPAAAAPSSIEHRTFAIPHSTFAIPHSTFQIYHFTGVHLWNVPLVYSLRRRGVPVVHTLHDLDPHTGVRFGGLIRLWNRLILASGCHILVHGRRYRDRLLAQGVPADRVTCTPLLHGFLSASHPWPPVVQATGIRGQEAGVRRQGTGGRTFDIQHSTFDIPHSTFQAPHSPSTVLFFGRVEAYKGVETLLKSWRKVKDLWGEETSLITERSGEWREVRELRELPTLIIAGPVAREVALPPLPPGVELRDRRILDEEADALFRAANLLVLPYRDATQSALIAAAYAYGVPVIVTRAGALPEYVVEGETGWVVPPDDPDALAAALAAALADPDRLRRMGAAGRAWFDAQRREEETALAEMYARLWEIRD